MHYFKKVIFLLIPFLYTGNTYAQDIFFNRITTEQGLSNNMVTDVIQDNQGFLWFATNNGLNRYDGYNFKVFRNQENDSMSFRSNQLTKLLLDEKGFLWIASQQGLKRLDLETYESVSFEHYPDNNNSLSNNEILSLCEDSSGYIWVGTNKGGLNRINQKTLEVSRIITGFNRVPSLFYDHPGKIWIGSDQNTIMEYNSINKTTKKFKIDVALEEESTIKDIWFIQRNNLRQLIIGMTSGIYRLEVDNGKFSKYLSNLGKLGSYRNNEIRFLQEDDKGRLWIGTWGKGIYILYPELNETRNYRIEPSNPNSLSNNDVNFIFEDKSGVTWIGTQDGLNKIDPAVKLFRHYQNNPNDPTSLNLNYVTAFEEAGFEKLWIGTFGGGMNLFDRKTEKFVSFQHDANNHNSLSNDAIRVIRKDHSDMLWIGTMNGLDKYNPNQQNFFHYRYESDNPNSIRGNNIMAITEDSRKNLWIGTYGDGLCSFNKDRTIIRNWNGGGNNNATFNGLFVRCIYEDSHGFIWVGLVENGGLYRYNPFTNEFTHFLSDENNTGTISHNNINSIFQDEAGRLWIGTWKGLDLFEYDSKTFSHISYEDGLPETRIVEIISDLEGDLWLSTHMGLSRIQFTDSTFRIINYSLRNGIQGNEFNTNAKFRSASGELYFGGTNGFNLFRPSEIHTNKYIPPVVITDIQIFNKSIQPGVPYDKRFILNKDISVTDTVRLKYSDKVISIGFSSLSFSNPGNNKFTYLMEGIDQDWVETSADRRFVTYTNLKPGEYKFHLKASNNDGIWNPNGRMLTFIISPPYYKTLWAYVFYSIVIILIILGIRRISMVRIKLKNDVLLERIEKTKLEEINQMKLRFFMNISHEFKTPLTLILGPLEELLSNMKVDREFFRNQLLLMHNNANRLLRLINQLMDFRKIEQGVLELSVSEGDIILYLRNIFGAFENFASKHNIDLSFSSTKDECIAWFDPDKLEKIIYNLISNAIKFTNDGGKVAINVSFSNPKVIKDSEIVEDLKTLQEKISPLPDSNEDIIIISVKDSGIGISSERLQYIFNRFYQIKESENLKRKLETEGTGIGLSLTKSLVISCKGEVEVFSTPGIGSEFIVKLPVKSYYFPDSTLSERIIDVSKIHYEPSLYQVEHEDLTQNITDPKLEEKEFEKNTPVLLIVEDNKELCTFIRYKFEPTYKVIEANDGEQGRLLAIEYIPDVIISDIMMPGMDGIELCQRLKNDFKTSHIPIILLTAKDSIESTLEGYEIGADDYIPKPFNLKLLAVRIGNLIESRQKLKENIRSQLILEPKGDNAYSTDEKFLEKAVLVVERNISNSEYNIDDFGSDLNMSRMQTYRKLKALTSLSANEFIRSIRLKKAAQILRSSNLNISEVTYEVGFSDPKYFSKCFQKQYGMTPSKYADKK